MVLLRHISIALTAAVAAFGSALFIVLSHLFKRQIWTPEVKYYAIQEEEEERRERQVLVLGLDGAGKSSVLQGLSGETATALRGQHCKPTRGFNFVRLNTPLCQLDFLEIGGGEDLRVYWADYLRKTHVLVYVVDSSDRHRLPQAKSELHRLLKANAKLPVVVLGNKQDKPGAVSMPDLHDALSLASMSDTRQLLLMPAQTGCSGLQSFKDLLLKLV
ncbi:ADP-ribosylation factor-like 10 [Clupea harengus]|uniref:ADP-ribosylation factor-like 10 n=1 Tax=Clupea harengus TaxID=7950 RepID=A0A6P8FXJ8_CLUHA|nr:ADP-ribosylation factor-like 10 [Clupea harengus]